MRPIKFRAWNKSRKRMIEVTSINFKDGTIQEEVRYAVNKKVYLDNVVLMQYTGSKDKNGVEIFEGDIVDLEGHTKSHRRVIKDSVDLYRFEELIGANTKDYGEVIGNIHENEGLLNEKI